MTVLDIKSHGRKPLVPGQVKPVEFRSCGSVTVDKDALEHALHRVAVDGGTLDLALQRMGGIAGLIKVMEVQAAVPTSDSRVSGSDEYTTAVETEGNCSKRRKLDVDPVS